MNLGMVHSSFWLVGIIAVFLFAFGKSLQNSKRIFYGTLLEAIAIFGLVFIAQQSISQIANSKVVLDFNVTQDKNLQIKNSGLINTEDFRIFITKYKLKSNTVNGHLSLPYEIDEIYRVPLPSSSIPIFALDANNYKNIDLKNLTIENPNYLPFYNFSSSTPENLNEFYALRVLFRNSVNKQKFVYYMITSSLMEPSLLDPLENSGLAGPYNGIQQITKLKQEIVSNQMSLFNDSPEDRYHN